MEKSGNALANLKKSTAANNLNKKWLEQDVANADALIRSVSNLCLTVKTLLGENIFGIGIVSLLRLGGTGLSKLHTTKDLGTYEEHHSLFGISQGNLCNCLDAADENDPLNWAKVFSWAGHDNVQIINPDSNKEQQKEQFLGWLETNINGFCMAFRNRTGNELDPLYSPLDILGIIDNIINGRFMLPELQWLKQASDAFTEVIENSGDYHHAVQALWGGDSIDSSAIDSVTKMADYLENDRRDMKVLFYNLGLLKVSRVEDSRIILSSILHLSTYRIVDILIRVYKGEGRRLSDEEVKAFYVNIESLAESIYAFFPMATRAVKAEYMHEPRDSVREIVVQDRLISAIYANLRHNKLFIGKHPAMDGYVDIPPFDAFVDETDKGDNSRGLQTSMKKGTHFKSNKNSRGIVIEVKMDRGDDENPMLTALRQAWDYRKKRKADSQQFLLMGIVFSWTEGGEAKLIYCHGRFAEKPTKEDLKRQEINETIA